MKRFLVSTFAAALLLGISWAQSSTESQGSTASPNASEAATAQSTGSQIAPGTVIPAELAKSLDAKKAKPNDEVVAKTVQDLLSHGQIVIPRGSKIIGHVTEAKARNKTESQSSISIAFDRLVTKDGHEMPLQAAVQAISAPPRATASMDSAAPMSENSGIPGAGRTMSGGGQAGSSGKYPGPTTTPSNIPSVPAGGAGEPANAGASTLSAGSQGVVGMPGLSLTNSAQGSVLSSSSQNVHLDSGTQMILRVNNQ